MANSPRQIPTEVPKAPKGTSESQEKIDNPEDIQRIIESMGELLKGHKYLLHPYNKGGDRYYIILSNEIDGKNQTGNYKINIAKHRGRKIKEINIELSVNKGITISDYKKNGETRPLAWALITPKGTVVFLNKAHLLRIVKESFDRLTTAKKEQEAEEKKRKEKYKNTKTKKTKGVLKEF